MRDDNKIPFDIDLSGISLGKAAHFKEVVAMPKEGFQSQENIFKAVFKSATNRKIKNSNVFELQY
ncbi:MAG: hypothetical protein JSS06_06910 [Proteobacteria bacterium]|nr:hypothetical protein [Pseudomonadota bacterium]